MSHMLNKLMMLLAFVAIFPLSAHAAKHRMVYPSHSSSSSSEDMQGKMMMDFSANYVRDTQENGSTDTAGKFSLGGMFNDWLGLDLQGLYEVKSKNYLVGVDLKIQITDWFFLKGGVGGYAEKDTHQFKTTPLASTGIMAPFASSQYYFLTEFSYFQVNDSNNVSFGAGLGFLF